MNTYKGTMSSTVRKPLEDMRESDNLDNLRAIGVFYAVDKIRETPNGFAMNYFLTVPDSLEDAKEVHADVCKSYLDYEGITLTITTENI